MKKTKIIIGAFMLAALSSANSFAQEASFRESIFGDGAIKAAEKGLIAGISEAKAQQEKSYIVKANPKYIFLDQTFIANSTRDSFNILLPRTLSDIQNVTPIISLANLSIMISVEYPYINLTIFREDYEIEDYDQPIKMALHALDNRAPEIYEGNDGYSLYISYEIENKKMVRKIADIKPTNFIVSAISRQVKLGETTKIVNVKEHLNVSLSSKNYKPVAKKWEGHKYFSFEIDSDSIDLKSGQNSLFLTFINENPKENVPVRIIEDSQRGIVVCEYTVGGVTYQDLIAEDTEKLLQNNTIKLQK